MKNSGSVLLYNCSGGKFSKLQQIFAMLRLRMRVVTPDRYHLPLSDLAQGLGEAGESAEAIPESMLVFCNVSAPLVQQILEILRVGKLPPIPLKAVMTESNKDWTSIQLYEELCKERQAVAEGKEAHNS